MAFQSRVPWSVALALIVAASVVAAGCSADRTTALTTTAIVRFPSGFHMARPDDDRPSKPAPARAKPVATEMATLRLENAHRRAEAAIAADADTTASGGFVCQIDMGAAPLD